MSFDINGTIMENVSGLNIKSGSSIFAKLNATGSLLKSSTHTLFTASHTTANWVNFSPNVWNAVPFNVAGVNVGSCFNPTYGSFTAPVSGLYLMSANCYCYNAGSVTGGYIHPTFWVNSSSGARRPGAGLAHRIRGHGCTGGYSFDGDICEIINLVAGDFVQHYVYSGNGTIAFYGQYSYFAGVFLG